MESQGIPKVSPLHSGVKREDGPTRWQRLSWLKVVKHPLRTTNITTLGVTHPPTHKHTQSHSDQHDVSDIVHVRACVFDTFFGVSISLSISVCLSLSLSLSLSVCVCVSLSLSLSLSVCVSLSLSLSICVCVCLSNIHTNRQTLTTQGDCEEGRGDLLCPVSSLKSTMSACMCVCVCVCVEMGH